MESSNENSNSTKDVTQESQSKKITEKEQKQTKEKRTEQKHPKLQKNPIENIKNYFEMNEPN